MIARANESGTDNVFRYHDETKHRMQRYARSLGYLDWATQPNPFRRYLGAPIIHLPLQQRDTSPPYDSLFTSSLPDTAPMTHDTLAALFEHSLAISAWKELQGARWALRCNPSSGNLHPTESYLIAGPIEGLHDRPGLYHYAPDKHALERRRELDMPAWESMRAQEPHTVFIALTSIYWREAWKYGERAYRYCELDIGHALGTLSLASATLGWRANLLDDFGTAQLADLLGLDVTPGTREHEREAPECLVAITAGPTPAMLPVAAWNADTPWLGKPNTLSADHVHWEIIDTVANATAKPAEPPTAIEPPQSTAISAPTRLAHRTHATAWQIVKQRRSAVAMDAATAIDTDCFYTMLARIMPSNTPPWPVWPYTPRVHLAIFVHRVTGLPQGLYLLIRHPPASNNVPTHNEMPSARHVPHSNSFEGVPNHNHHAPIDILRAAFRPEFTWETPQDCPPTLPLFRLTSSDCRRAATQVCCMQDIAGDGAFSVGMIAEFDHPIRTLGPWMYPRLFWECGLIGQVLYLEAEAAGVRATGIGCFFDDLMHDLLGIQDCAFQSLYHFTVGGPVEDHRLTTHSPYNPVPHTETAR